MGYFFIKVIEARQLAVRTNFFVNYPFIRLILGKEKRNTNYKPGIEWWDKIVGFKVWKESGRDLTLTIEGRDKSIHVFGSDWNGEATIDIKDLCDGRVHQKWVKLGRGRRIHNRAPRGYVHLAFQYVEEGTSIDKRPFAKPPVEPVLTFEEWLAREENSLMEDFKRMKEPEPERPKIKYSSSPAMASASTDTNPDSIRGSSEDRSSDVNDKKLHSAPSNTSISSESSCEYVPTADLIDLSFDTSPSALSNSSSTNSSPSLSSSTSLNQSNNTDSNIDSMSRQTNPFTSGWYNEYSHNAVTSDQVY